MIRGSSSPSYCPRLATCLRCVDPKAFSMRSPRSTTSSLPSGSTSNSRRMNTLSSRWAPGPRPRAARRGASRPVPCSRRAATQLPIGPQGPVIVGPRETGVVAGLRVLDGSDQHAQAGVDLCREGHGNQPLTSKPVQALLEFGVDANGSRSSAVGLGDVHGRGRRRCRSGLEPVKHPTQGTNEHLADLTRHS